METFFDLDFNANFNPDEPNLMEDDEFCEEVTCEGKKFHKCTYANCGKTFRFKSEFLRHKVIHVVQRPFTCTFEGCNKTFKREDALKNHLRIHTGEMPFQCEVEGCGLSFTTKAGLRYHHLKHKGEKMCTCSFPGCGKSFLTMAQLKQHESASNYHNKVNHVVEKVEYKPAPAPIKIEKEKDIFLDEFFAPEIKPIENMQWEMKDQNMEEGEINFDLQENFEKMVKVILKENNMLKQRLDMCNTLMNLVQENNALKEKLNKTDGIVEPMPVATDDSIYSFLSFYEEKH